MYFREIYKFSQNCAPNSLHTWVGPEVFLFYGIYSLDVERPPAPSPVCNELGAHCTSDSSFQSFLHITQYQLNSTSAKLPTLYVILIH